MNKIQKGKTALLVLSIISLVASIVFLVLGIVMLANSLSGDNVQVAKMVFGIVFILLFAPFVILGCYGLFVGIALKATNGSIAQGNLGKGTVNATLCVQCGTKLYGEKFCPKCGTETNGMIMCKKCGEDNDRNNSHCTSCGAELK